MTAAQRPPDGTRTHREKVAFLYVDTAAGRKPVITNLAETLHEQDLILRPRVYQSTPGWIMVGSRPEWLSAAKARTALRRIDGAASEIFGKRIWSILGFSEPAQASPVALAHGARWALTLGRAHVQKPRAFLYDDLLLDGAICADMSICRRLAALLDPIACEPRGHRPPGYLACMEAFLDHDLSFARASRALGIHRHTLEKKLSAAEELLGRSLHDAWDRTLIETARRARRLLLALDRTI